MAVALGANMAEKASQKGARRLGDFGSCLRLGGVLGGSWKLLGPKSPQETICDVPQRCGRLLAQPWIRCPLCSAQWCEA